MHLLADMRDFSNDNAAPQVWAEKNARIGYCPAGFLMAMGMKLFEGVHTSSDRDLAADLLTYIQLLQNFLRSGLIDTNSFNSFPIYDAFQMVGETMQIRRTAPRGPPTTVTMVVSACREDLRFLGQDIPANLREITRIAIVQKCGDFRDRWLKKIFSK